jgi:hypothetical protein
MSDESGGEGIKKEESGGLLGLAGSFLKAISLKTKLILGIIVSVFGFIALNMFRKKWNDKEILEFELEKVRAEIEIEVAQKDISENNHKLEALQVRADEIVKEIVEMEAPNPERKVSKEELDDFFDERGF